MADSAASSTHQSAAKPSLGRRLINFVAEGAIIIVGAVVISVLLRTFVAQLFEIPSGSMENTLQVNDRVLVAKFGGFQRGDVVVFEDPGGWLPEVPHTDDPITVALQFIGIMPNASAEHLIKRIIGMPGDRVKCCTEDGNLTINGYELDESAYLYSESGAQVAPAKIPFEVVVPAEHIFVMGDHRDRSADSRCQLTDISQNGPPGSKAFVPMSKVVGAAVAIVSPLHRLATFVIPNTFHGVPAPTEPAPEEAVIVEASPNC